MNEEDILEIVENAFDDQISAEAWENCGASVIGKPDFLKEVTDKLKLLFEANDLSK